MKKITGMDWLKKQISLLETSTSKHEKQINKIRKIKPEICNEFKPWTPLKLILLNYSLNVCTMIINKNPHIFNKMYYIDLFAGSGINRIKNDYFIGSPFISILNHAKSYNSLIFCERDPAHVDALEKRITALGIQNVSLFKGACESNLSRILKIVRGRKKYSFFFIDPFSMQLKWHSMRDILNTRSDIIFTFMTSQIYREICSAREMKRKATVLNQFFGDGSWKKADSWESAVQIYKDNILNIRPEAPIRSIEIKSEKNKGFCYHLLFITNKTKKENRWLRAIDKAKSEIEKNSDIAVELAISLVKKRQLDLKHFQ